MIGQTLGHYRIVEKIGQGGMGVVYRARDERLERDVALKVLPAGLLADEGARRRFRKEALALSKLNHANIATVYDFDSQGGVDFLAMEYVEGTSIADRLKSDGFSEKEVATLGAQIALALEEAHEHGVVHRDLKPGNILVTPKGRIKVLDFGLARLLRPRDDLATAESITQTQAVSGTLLYMAPEQLRGEAADPRNDIHSAGSVLYEMATGQRTFREELPSRLMDAILHQPPISPRALNGKLSLEFERITLKCLEKEPENRYQSARDLEVDLRRLASGSAIAAAPLARPANVTWRRAALFTGIGIVLLAAVLAGLDIGGLRERLVGRPYPPQIRSLAVLPLENLSRNSEDEYFADSMTEAIITDLAKISALRVVSRTSVMRFKQTQKPLPEIARELNVDAVVEGSVERAGERVKISAQLIRAATDQHLWAEAYERDLRDVLVLQDEVAASIAREIRVKLKPEEKQRLTSAHQVDPEAYQLYLKGRYFWLKRSPEAITKGIDYFRAAIDKDPSYAAAYSGLADCYSSLGFSFNVGSQPPKEVQPKAKAAALKALELDDSLADAHNSLAYVKLNYDWDWPGAEVEFKRALELNPGNADAHHWYSHFLISSGRFEESLAESNSALDLDQLSPVMNAHLGWHYVFAREYDQALEQLRKTLDLDPNFGQAYWFRGLALEQKGKYADALVEMSIARDKLKGNLVVESDIGHVYAVSGDKKNAETIISKLKQESAGRYINPYEIALINSGLGQKDQSFEWLEQAFRERSDMLVYLKVDPRLDPIRSDPRFQSLVRRVGIPQ